MAGIVFLQSKDLSLVKPFYESLGATVWIDQGDCIIYKHDNFLFGFCERETVNPGWLLTFFYQTKEEVDRIYEILKDRATSKPVFNSKYNI